MNDEFILNDELVNKLEAYIHENFELDGTCHRMIDDAIRYVAAQGYDEDETVSLIYTLINAIGIEEDEIRNALT